MTIELSQPGPAVRGRLALFIEGAIERALEEMGAPPPGVGASSDLDASLSDQLYRARLAGKDGIALAFGTLEGIANLAGTLDAEDSAVLRWWLRAMTQRPIRLLFEEADLRLGVYGEPESLRTLLADAEEPKSGPRAVEDAPAASPEVAASIAAMALSALSSPPPPPADAEPIDAPSEMDADSAVEKASPDLSEEALARLLEEEPEHTLPDQPPVFSPDEEQEAKAAEDEDDAPSADAVISETAREIAERLTDDEGDGWLKETLMELSTPPPAIEMKSEDDHADEAWLQEECERELTPPSLDALTSPPGAVEEADSDEREEECADDEGEIEAGSDDVVEASSEDAAAEPDVEASEEHIAPPPPEPIDEEMLARCAAWKRELESAHGPKPLAVVERLFVSAYVPLRDAVIRGVAPKDVEPVLAEWATSFERSYSEAFNALKVRGKRPTMVLDIPDVALRVGRLHGARNTQLLLVDGMRFDLGMRIHEKLKAIVDGQAACAERLLLWSALPSTTGTQVELIGRGPGGLRDFTGEVDEKVLVAHGRKCATIRRLRTGNREVLKLDIAEARLGGAGGPEDERLDAVATEVAERLAAHFNGVPEKTMVMLFGDHGFILDPREGGGTTAARQGGASPEEVLVPAFAWIAGAVH